MEAARISAVLRWSVDQLLFGSPLESAGELLEDDRLFGQLPEATLRSVRRRTRGDSCGVGTLGPACERSLGPGDLGRGTALRGRRGSEGAGHHRDRDEP